MVGLNDINGNCRIHWYEGSNVKMNWKTKEALFYLFIHSFLLVIPDRTEVGIVPVGEECIHQGKGLSFSYSLELLTEYRVSPTAFLRRYIYTCYIVTYVDSHLHTCTYICRIIHNDTTTKTDARRKTQEWRTQEDFFRKIFTSHFIARVRKGCSRFCMWEGAGDRT